MLLHKILLDLRCKEAQRDIADPYEMHSTLCRAFSPPEIKCPEGALLWRLEPEQNGGCVMAKVLIQSRELPYWQRIIPTKWFGEAPSKPLNLEEKLNLKTINKDMKFRYRLRANPSVCKNGKRFGLFSAKDQLTWINRQGERNGFSLLSTSCSEERMLTGKNRTEYPIRIFSVLYDGVLAVKNPELFYQAIKMGIGHGKTMGLGLFSVVPI
jgi:CRISPR system Cascade subunit CasE